MATKINGENLIRLWLSRINLAVHFLFLIAMFFPKNVVLDDVHSSNTQIKQAMIMLAIPAYFFFFIIAYSASMTSYSWRKYVIWLFHGCSIASCCLMASYLTWSYLKVPESIHYQGSCIASELGTVYSEFVQETGGYQNPLVFEQGKIIESLSHIHDGFQTLHIFKPEVSAAEIRRITGLDYDEDEWPFGKMLIVKANGSDYRLELMTCDVPDNPRTDDEPCDSVVFPFPPGAVHISCPIDSARFVLVDTLPDPNRKLFLLDWAKKGEKVKRETE